MITGTGAAWRRGAAILALAAMAALMCGERADAQVYAIALPDVHNKRLSVHPPRIPAGGVVEIRSAVQNLGAGALTPAHSMAEDGPTLTIRFLLVRNVKDKSGLDAGSWSLNALERREVAQHAVLWVVPETLTPGTWFLCAEVDPQNRVRESNELNNRTCLPLTVEAMPEPGAGMEEPFSPHPEGGPPRPEENP